MSWTHFTHFLDPEDPDDLPTPAMVHELYDAIVERFQTVDRYIDTDAIALAKASPILTRSLRHWTTSGTLANGNFLTALRAIAPHYASAKETLTRYTATTLQTAARQSLGLPATYGNLTYPALFDIHTLNLTRRMIQLLRWPVFLSEYVGRNSKGYASSLVQPSQYETTWLAATSSIASQSWGASVATSTHPQIEIGVVEIFDEIRVEASAVQHIRKVTIPDTPVFSASPYEAFMVFNADSFGQNNGTGPDALVVSGLVETEVDLPDTGFIPLPLGDASGIGEKEIKFHLKSAEDLTILRDAYHPDYPPQLHATGSINMSEDMGQALSRLDAIAFAPTFTHPYEEITP